MARLTSLSKIEISPGITFVGYPMDLQTEQKLNDEFRAKRISTTFQYGTFKMIDAALDSEGIRNRSKWIERVLRKEALRLLERQERPSGRRKASASRLPA